MGLTEVCPTCGDVAHADRAICSMFHSVDGLICTCTGPDDDGSTVDHYEGD